MNNTVLSIIGLGASGTSVFVQLVDRLKFLKNSSPNLTINLFELSSIKNKGIAYCAESKTSLLNTTVERTILFSNDQYHFYRWLRANKTSLMNEHPELVELTPEDYVPRGLFGLYLQETFESYYQQAAKLGITVNVFNEEVVNIVNECEKAFLLTDARQKYRSDFIILTTGHLYLNPYSEFNGASNFYPEPYPESRFITRIKPNSKVLILGSRLTGIDCALAILNANEKQIIYLASRTGQMPMIKAACERANPTIVAPENLPSQLSVEKILELLKAEFLSLYSNQEDALALLKSFCLQDDFIAEYQKTKSKLSKWQGLALMFDEFVEACWKNLSPEQRPIFINELYKFLTRFTATMPLSTAEQLAYYFETNRLVLIPGLRKLNLNTSGLFSVETQDREFESLVFDSVINATGYSNDLSSQTLYRNLVEAGIVTLNQFGSLEVNQDREVKHYNLNASRLFALGPPIFGTRIIVDFMLFIAQDAEKVVAQLIDSL